MISLIYGILKKKKLTTSKQQNSTNSQIQRTDWWLSGVREQGMDEMNECGEKAQTSSYNINKSWG